MNKEVENVILLPWSQQLRSKALLFKMKVIQELGSFATLQQETALTVGVFDGVHLGHQKLLKELAQQAAQKKLLPGVITFDRHPEEVLSPGRKLPYLTELEERKNLIQSLGISSVFVLSFTLELSRLTAREFIGLLKKYLKLRMLVMGPDFALGRNREGNLEMLQELGKEFDFEVVWVPPLKFEGKAIRSTLVREALSRGELGEVAKLLGRDFTLSGEVLAGSDRGENLGFPTANLSPDSSKFLPPDGVYATWAWVGSKIFSSVTNIGFRPTFGGEKRWVEVHIPGFQGKLYGKKLTVEFVKRLRGEIHFSSSEELKDQIEKDIENAKTFLEKRKWQKK